MKRYTMHTSDPMGSDFALVDENGNKVEGVIEFTLRGYPREPLRLEIELIPQGVNIQSEVSEVTFRCPNCEGAFSHECRPETLSGS